MAREASNELAKLRNMKKRSIDPLISTVADKAGAHQSALKELGPVHSRSWAQELAAASEAGRDTVRTLRQVVAEAIAELEKRATRAKHPPSELTKSDIRYMLENHGTVAQICDWILAVERQDGFSSLREVLTQLAFANPKLYENMEGVPTSLRTPQKWLEKQEGVILEKEKLMMDATQLAAMQELEEVMAMKNHLLQNLDNVDGWLSTALSSNGPARQPALTEWYTLEPQPVSNQQEAYSDNRSWR